MRRVATALVLAAGLGVGLAGCVGHDAVATNPAGLGFVQGADGGYVQGGPAPVLSGSTIQGARLSTAADAGKVVVINFWASWCGPCRTEGPAFESVYRATAKRGVAFVGVLFEDNPTNASSYDREANVTYPSLIDSTGSMLARFRHYGLSSIPDTVVVGRNGRVAAAFSGPILARTLQTVVDKELAAPVPRSQAGSAPAAGRYRGPALSGPTVQGGRAPQAVRSGSVTVVGFWASWCPVCRAQAVALQRLARAGRRARVAVYGVDVEDSRASARAFVRDRQLTYPNRFDPTGAGLAWLRARFGTAVLPATVVVSRDGRVAAALFRLAPARTLQALVARAVAA